MASSAAKQHYLLTFGLSVLALSLQDGAAWWAAVITDIEVTSGEDCDDASPKGSTAAAPAAVGAQAAAKQLQPRYRVHYTEVRKTKTKLPDC